jgi:hypothetical protein
MIEGVSKVAMKHSKEEGTGGQKKKEGEEGRWQVLVSAFTNGLCRIEPQRVNKFQSGIINT